MEAAPQNYEMPIYPSVMALHFEQVLTFHNARFILGVGLTIEYQLQVRDVFSIRLETRCAVSTKPSVEI
jgi:hypothetical protein